MAARQDFTISAGRDYGIQIALFEEDQETPLSLLDCNVKWAVSRMAGSPILIAKTSDIPTEIEITSVDQGLLIIHVQQLDTELLGALTCDHELLVTDITGAEATVMRGLITILRSIIH